MNMCRGDVEEAQVLKDCWQLSKVVMARANGSPAPIREGQVQNELEITRAIMLATSVESILAILVAVAVYINMKLQDAAGSTS